MLIRRGLFNTGGKGADKYEETVLVSRYNMSSTGTGISFSTLSPNNIQLADGDYIKVDLRGIAKPSDAQNVFMLTSVRSLYNAYVAIKAIQGSNADGTTYCNTSIADGSRNSMYIFYDIAHPANMSFTMRFVEGYLKFEDIIVNGDKFQDLQSSISYSEVNITYFALSESRLNTKNYLGITYGKKL